VLRVRWSTRTQDDLRRISAYWQEQNPATVPALVRAIYRRVNWLADGRPQLGAPIVGLPHTYRVYRERTFGYKIYYRVEGSPPDETSILTIRHSRERPLRPSTIRRFTK
jgi:plasmid stabilization system protein ParE